MASFTAQVDCLLDFIPLFTIVACIMSPKLATPVYSMDINSSDFIDYHDIVRFEHFHEPFDQRVYGKLNIEVIDVSPSSIYARWRLTNLTHSDSVLESTFLCETFNGRIVSDKLHANTDSFRFEFLNSNTEYVICVHLLEKSRLTNTSILHYNCQPFSTIPVIRSDSVYGLVLTFGYFLLVLVLGYLAWYRKARMMKILEEEEKIREENKGDKEDDYCQYVRAAERGGLYAYGEEVGANGGSVYKEKYSSADCSAACVPFSAKEEEELIEYNASRREISF